jgi:hypothetical protein
MNIYNLYAEAKMGNRVAYSILQDYFIEQGREDVALLWHGPDPRLQTNRVNRIDKITKKQQKELEEYAKENIAYGLSTKPIDEHLFIAGIYGLYSGAKLPIPGIQWVNNPVEIFIDSVQNSVGNSVADSVGNSVWNSVGNSVADSVQNSVWNSVRDSVWVSARNSVRDSVQNSVWNSVWDSAVDSVWNSVGNSVSGQFEIHIPAYYLAYIDILHLAIDPVLEHRLRCYMATCRSASWWYPGSKIVKVSQRPSIIRTDPVYVKWNGFEVGNDT